MEIQRTNKRGKIVFCCMLLLLSFLVVVSNSESTQEETIEADRLKNNNNNFPSKWKMLSSPPWLTLIDHWEAIKNKCLAKAPSVLKPNSGFREDKEEGGAVGKSLEKAKETIEDSAKSAAKMANEAADGLKNTKSYKTDPQDEL